MRGSHAEALGLDGQGTIVRWLTASGSRCVGDELVEIETDKATMSTRQSSGLLTIVARGQTLPVAVADRSDGATLDCRGTGASPVASVGAALGVELDAAAPVPPGGSSSATSQAGPQMARRPPPAVGRVAGSRAPRGLTGRSSRLYHGPVDDRRDG